MSIRDICLVGAGAIAGHHLRAIQALPEAGTIRVHVTDCDPTVLQRFCQEHAGAIAYPDLEALLARAPGPDEILIVATPPSVHAAIAQAALRSGRHVLCEKPLAINRAEAKAMLATARRHGRHLGCCSGRFLGPERDAARALMAQELGRIYHVRWIDRRPRNRSGIEYQPGTAWFLQRQRSGGGALMDWGPYDLSTLNHLLQPQRLEVLHAVCERPDIGGALPSGVEPDVEYHIAAGLRLTLAQGQRCTVAYERSSACHAEGHFEQSFAGTRAGLALPAWGDGGYRLIQDDGGSVQQHEHAAPLAEQPGPHARPLHYFLQAISQGEPEYAVMDARAVFNFVCLQAIYACADSGQPKSVDMEEFA